MTDFMHAPPGKASVWLDIDDLRRVLEWYAGSHSTGDMDEDEMQDELAGRFKAAARWLKNEDPLPGVGSW